MCDFYKSLHGSEAKEVLESTHVKYKGLFWLQMHTYTHNTHYRHPRSHACRSHPTHTHIAI